MEIDKSENEYFIQLKGIDKNNEEFNIEIQKDCSQIRIDKEFGNTHIGLDYHSLTLLFSCIKEVLERYKKRV